jgi:hypothetical protein
MYEYDIVSTLSGAPTTATLIYTLPDSIDTTKFSSTQVPPLGNGVIYDNAGTNYHIPAIVHNGGNTVVPLAATASGTYLTTTGVTQAIPITFGASDVVQVRFKVPIVGLTATSAAVRADQTNYDWTSYTPGFNGWGTPTNIECQHKRDGSDLVLRCKYTAGTTTAAEARVNLPGSLVAATSSRIPSIQKCGELVVGATGASTVHMLCEPSVGYLTFGIQAGGTSGLSKVNGNSFTSSIVYSFTARVPIDGWIESQNAPILVGSVVQNGSGSEVISRVRIANACGASPCTITDSINVSSVTRSSTGVYVVNFSTAYSSTPTCTVGIKNGNRRFQNISSESASAITLSTIDESAAAADVGFNMICIGPR